MNTWYNTFISHKKKCVVKNINKIGVLTEVDVEPRKKVQVNNYCFAQLRLFDKNHNSMLISEKYRIEMEFSNLYLQVCYNIFVNLCKRCT